MNILGIETSCDETAAAVVQDGRKVLSNVVYTQIPLHQPYGGVVPELASRAHVEKIREVVGAAMREANAPIDAVAVTYGPGLSPALIVGLNAAKGLALSLGKPLIAINHMEAHLHTPFLDTDVPIPESALGFAVSGGHSCWIDMPTYGEYHLIGQTLDDAAGEAFDKASKLLGLGYPGGPKVDKIAKEWWEKEKVENGGGGGELGGRAVLKEPPPVAMGTARGKLIPFPKGRPREGVTALAGLPAELCVSFSGLKTALLRYVQQHPDMDVDLVVTSYQEAIVQALADRTRTALWRRGYRALIVGGGVSLNSRLRTVLGEVAREAQVDLLMARPKYCGDNGAMIAGMAYYRRNIMGEAAMNIDAAPSLDFV